MLSRLGMLAFLAIFPVLLILPGASASSMDIIQNGISGSLTSGIEIASLSGGSDYILFGTELGAYVFTSSGSLVNFIQTGGSVTGIKAVPDINGNSHMEVILTTNDAYFPNVLCFDSSTGEKLWEFSSETEVFDMDMLWTMKQVNVHTIKVSDDGRIYLTAGYNVYCLDSSSGGIIWSYEGTDNMWDLDIVDGDIVVGDQNGYVYRLSGGTGELVWRELVSQPYDVVSPSTKQLMGTVKRSVWDIIPLMLGGERRLAAACEDGFLHILDSSGGLLHSAEIIDYSDELLYGYYGDYPVPTSVMDYNFFNVRAIEIPDATGDGGNDVLVYTYPGARTGSEYQGAQEGIFTIDSSSGEIICSNENMELTYVDELGMITITTPATKNYILLPIGKSGSEEKVRVIYPKECSMLSTISINSTAGGGFKFNGYATKDLSNGEFIMASDYGDLMRAGFSGETKWSYPRLNRVKVERANLVGSAAEDLLVRSMEGAQEDDFLDEGTSRTIIVIDGETREVAWTYELSYDEFLLTGGLQGVQLIPDVNNDGRMDIAAFKQRGSGHDISDEYGEHTRIMVFSGTGSKLWEKPMTNDTYYGIYEMIFNDDHYLETYMAYEWGFPWGSTNHTIPTEMRGEFRRQLEETSQRLEEQEQWLRIRKPVFSLDSVSDVSGDGIPDLIVGGQKDVIIMDAVTGEPVWNRTYDGWVYEDPFGNKLADVHWNWSQGERMRYFSLGDTNSDGYDELLQTSWEGIMMLRSTTAGGRLDYVVDRSVRVDDGNIDENTFRVIDDVSGDGLPDVIFLVHVEDSPSVYRIVEGTDGTRIMELEREGTSVSLAPADFDSDGINDTIVFYAYGNQGPRLEVLGGKNGESIWSHEEYEETWMLRDVLGITSIKPACPMDDMDGDGTEELVLGRSLPWDAGAELLVYSLGSSKPLKSVTVEASDPMRSLEEMRWQPAVVTERLPDLTGDGVSEIATVMALGEGSQKQLKLMIVDVMNGEIISDFTARGTEIQGLGEEIAVYGTGGQIFLLKPGREISITSPQDGGKLTSPITVTWDGGEDTVKLMMVNGRKVMKTSGESAEFDIKEGEVKVSLYSFDSYGKGVYDSVDVTITKDSAAELPLTILVIILLGILFLPRLLPMIRKGGFSIPRIPGKKPAETGGKEKEGKK